MAGSVNASHTLLIGAFIVMLDLDTSVSTMVLYGIYAKRKPEINFEVLARSKLIFQLAFLLQL